MPRSPMRVCLIGRSDSPDMQPVTTSLARLAPEAIVERAADGNAAAALVVDRGQCPDLVVVCQHWPDEYAPADVSRLIACAPLARYICCHAAWCESDGRNRDIWPPAIRVPVPMFASRLRRELDVLHGTRPPLPLTASRDEAFAFSYSPDPCQVADRARIIAIQSPDCELKRWLGDMLTAAGHKCVSPPGETPTSLDAILWDLDPWNPERLKQELEHTRRALGAMENIEIIGLLGLTHPEDVDIALSLGVRCIVAKLAPADAILAAVA